MSACYILRLLPLFLAGTLAVFLWAGLFAWLMASGIGWRIVLAVFVFFVPVIILVYATVEADIKRMRPHG